MHEFKVVDEKTVEVDGVIYRKAEESECCEKEEKSPASKYDGEEVYSINTNYDEGDPIVVKYVFDSSNSTHCFNESIGNVFRSEELAVSAIDKLQKLNRAGKTISDLNAKAIEQLNDAAGFIKKSFNDVFGE